MKLKLELILVLALLPLLSLAGGRELYSENCEKCHGFSQQGSLGLPLYRSTIANHSDRYLQRTIKSGRPGRVMQGFNFSDNQITELIRFLRAGIKAPKYDVAAIKGNVKNGQGIYKKYCQSCHGYDLKGGQGIGKNFSWQKDRLVSPPSLINRGFLYSAEDQMIKHIIANGIKNTEMVPFVTAFNFTDQMLNDVVSFIRSHEKPPSYKNIIRRIREPVSFIYDSPYKLKETVKKIRNSVASYNFRVYANRTLLEGLRKENFSVDDKKQVVIRFCNFNNMQNFLKIEPRLGVMLPCRVTVVEDEQGKVRVVLANYKYAVARFNNEQISEAAIILIKEMQEMVEEALW